MVYLKVLYSVEMILLSIFSISLDIPTYFYHFQISQKKINDAKTHLDLVRRKTKGMIV